MNPLVTLSELNAIALQVMTSASIIIPGVLGLMALRAFRQWREDKADEAFRDHCRSVDVTDWHSKRVA